MDSLEQEIERERPINRNYYLAVEDEPPGFYSAHRVNHLGEIAGERLPRLGLQLDPVSVAERDAPESVPFRLVLPAVPFGNPVLGPGLHRGEGRLQRESF